MVVATALLQLTPKPYVSIAITHNNEGLELSNLPDPCLLLHGHLSRFELAEIFIIL